MILVRFLLQTVVTAFTQIWANKLRAVLTTLGVIIGVASICIIVAALTGFRANVLGEFEKLGVNRVYIDGWLPPELRNKLEWRDVQLSIQEIDAIVRDAESIVDISPEWSASGSLAYRDVLIDQVRARGIRKAFHTIENRAVIQGRSFSSVDQQERRLVCLVNDKAIEELNLPTEPIGEFVLFDDRRFMIVGVVETIEAGAIQFGPSETSAEVFVPFETARNVLNPAGWINQAWGQLKQPDMVEQAKGEIDRILRRERQLDPDHPELWRVEVLQQYIDQFNRIAGAIVAVVSGIVAISLLVGGIGIMNIMLVSVSERTREIGLRKALGAQPAVVLLQFLVEAIVLCLFGAAVGVAVAAGGVWLLKAAAAEQLGSAAIPLWSIILSMGFSITIGVVFGMFPAIKAARLDPIDALRHE